MDSPLKYFLQHRSTVTLCLTSFLVLILNYLCQTRANCTLTKRLGTLVKTSINNSLEKYEKHVDNIEHYNLQKGTRLQFIILYHEYYFPLPHIHQHLSKLSTIL